MDTSFYRQQDACPATQPTVSMHCIQQHQHHQDDMPHHTTFMWCNKVNQFQAYFHKV